MIHTSHDLVQSRTVIPERSISLVRLLRSYQLPIEKLLMMVEYGIIEPLNEHASHIRWQFSMDSMPRIRTALHLEVDLEINMAGSALALELLDEIKQLRKRLELN